MHTYITKEIPREIHNEQNNEITTGRHKNWKNERKEEITEELTT